VKYTVEVEGRTHQVEIEDDRFLVDGQLLDVDVRRIAELPLYSLLVNSESAEVAVEEESRFRYQVMLGGELYSVLVQPPGRSGGPRRHGTADNVVRAPMPGLVASVAVAPGDEVKAGSALVVLESMKMENPLMAPADATVAQVHVQPRQSVKKSQPLVTLHFTEAQRRGIPAAEEDGGQ